MKSHGYKRVKLSELTLGERVREDYGDIAGLKDSIKENLLMQPIVVDKNLTVIAGGRRFRALKALEVEKGELIEIDVHIIECDNDLEFRSLELVENLARKEMDWKEVVKGQKALHAIRQKLFGASGPGAGNKIVEGELGAKPGGWKVQDTADELGMHRVNLQRNFEIARYLEDPRYAEKVASADNAAQAMKIIMKIKEDALAAEITRRQQEEVQKVDVDSVHDSITQKFVCGDALELIKHLGDESVDCIITDPPYGINIDDLTRQFDKTGGEGHYDDSVDNFWRLINGISDELFRVMKKDSWMILFFAIEHYQPLQERLTQSGFNVIPKPFLWVKTSPSGTNIPNHRVGSQYECAFMVRKGMPLIHEMGHGDIKIISGLSGHHKTHPAEKPVALMQHLLELFSAKGDIVFDPFAGSGSVAKACVETKREFVCFELDPSNHADAVIGVRDVITGEDKLRKLHEMFQDNKDNAVIQDTFKEFFGRVKNLSTEESEPDDYWMRTENGYSQINEGQLFVEKYSELFYFKNRTAPTAQDLDAWYRMRAQDPHCAFDPNFPDDRTIIEKIRSKTT